MDSTVIQEIANQLGMAVDQAGQFIQDQLPSFAALKTMQAAVPMITLWTIFVVLAIASLICLAICAHFRRRDIIAKNKEKADMQEGKRFYYSRIHNTDWDDHISFYAFGILGISALTVMACAIFITGNCVTEIIGWSNYPEAMLIDMALKAV